MWYRAVGVGECVSFLDYGNQDPSKEKKKLPAKFIHPVEGYAMPLRLCVRASGEEWTEESAQIFDSFIECDLEAEIISVDFDSIVDLRAKDDSLSKIYVDGGHAVRFDTPLMNHNLFDDILEDELPSGKVPASVTAITSVNDFYIQENSKMDVLDLLASKLDAAESFEVIEKPSLGQNLIAKFVEDSIWYRAKVIHQESSETEVLFLDYGNVSPATEFRVLPIELSAFPFLSWHCSLNMEDTPAINNHFKSLVDDGTVFDISFREKKGNVWVVQLTVNNVSPFDSTTIPENRNVEIPVATAENIVEVQARPILPALGKPLYKDCVLCHSNGPYDFYVQTDDDHIQIEEMANSLFEAGTFPKIDAVKKGDFVVAQFSEDDAYYRAVVTDVEPEVVVHFIDYGNSCPASCFHELPTPLKAIPQLAIRCSLQSPIGGWSVDAIDKFTSLLNSDTKAIDLKIISKGDPSIVDVEINGASITKQLAPDAKFETESIQESLPVNDEETILPSSGVCYIASVTSKECYIHDSSVSADLDVITEQLASIDVSDVNCEIKDAKVGDLVGACHEDALYRACVTKLDPQEVYFIDYGNSSPVAKFFKLPQSIKNKKPLAIKVKLDLGEGMELNDDGLMELQSLAVDGVNYTQTKPSVVELKVGVDKVTDLLKSHLVVADSIGDASESKSVPPSTSGEAVPITISHVNSPSEFYYQVDSSKVNEMSSRLTEAEQFSTIDKCDVGQVICAKFSEDELWYRARVLTTEPSVTVFFLDYGNTYEVKEMKQLPDDLSKIPPLCVKASLEHQDIEWTEEEIDKFSEIAFGNPSLTSSIIENGADVVHVRLDSSEVGDSLDPSGQVPAKSQLKHWPRSKHPPRLESRLDVN
ncbi:hypothetical protein GE061_017546 [Apolygus lucorum]|uniref:Tudor domain-containing protein n=1 Tax=Apolygus lucorum TaxID=248454 RepID=A0A8S9XFC3_APOLU|nr:hypothetical protein GE061_017546 [Apolygus lucorum]